MMFRYIKDYQVLKGVKPLKNASWSCQFSPFEKTFMDELVILLNYFERRRDMEDVEVLMNSLNAKGIISSI